MKPCNTGVTDHAILRYLERVKGVNIQALRADIANKVTRAREHEASGAIVGGFRYVLDHNGIVVTVEVVNRPAVHIGSYRRKPEIHEE